MLDSALVNDLNLEEQIKLKEMIMELNNIKTIIVVVDVANVCRYALPNSSGVVSTKI